MAEFTYDITTDIGKVRMLCTDVTESDYTFTDAEIQVFIDLKEDDLWEAAALACETWARTRMKLSASLRAADGSAVVRRTTAELLELACNIRQAALRGTLKTGVLDVSTPDDYLESYRPVWRDFDDTTPVVE